MQDARKNTLLQLCALCSDHRHVYKFCVLIRVLFELSSFCQLSAFSLWSVLQTQLKSVFSASKMFVNIASFHARRLNTLQLHVCHSYATCFIIIVSHAHFCHPLVTVIIIIIIIIIIMASSSSLLTWNMSQNNKRCSCSATSVFLIICEQRAKFAATTSMYNLCFHSRSRITLANVSSVFCDINSQSEDAMYIHTHEGSWSSVDTTECRFHLASQRATTHVQRHLALSPCSCPWSCGLPCTPESIGMSRRPTSWPLYSMFESLASESHPSYNKTSRQRNPMTSAWQQSQLCPSHATHSRTKIIKLINQVSK